MNSHRELIVWQKSTDLVLLVYKYTKSFPEDERFNLISQIRRSAVSIPSNIAEGYGRKSRKEFAQFLRISFGSSAELETQIEIAYRLDLLSKNNYEEVQIQITEVRKMINKLISYLRTKN